MSCCCLLLLLLLFIDMATVESYMKHAIIINCCCLLLLFIDRATVESYMKRNKDITDPNYICHVMSKLIQKGIESY